MTTPFNDVHVTLDNDNTPILVDGQGNRVIDSDGEIVTLWPHQPISVCDNTILPPDLKVESSFILRGGEINPPNRATRRARKKAK